MPSQLTLKQVHGQMDLTIILLTEGLGGVGGGGEGLGLPSAPAADCRGVGPGMSISTMDMTCG
jgi:hypothetical protein